MKTTKKRQAYYRLEGEFLEFVFESGREYKYIKVQVKERIIPIKLAKELRSTLSQKLVKGDRLSLFLEQTSLQPGSKLKLKTDRVDILGDRDESLVSPSPATEGKILLCHQSSCGKKGSKRLYIALVESLKQLGLQNQVKIEMTRCQKQCKQGLSLTLMPGNVKHSHVNPDNLTSLLQAHYLPTPN